MARAACLAIMVAVGMALAISTGTRVRVWQSETRLWADAAQKAPRKPRAFVNLGNQYAFAGDRVRARAAYEQASVLALDPTRFPDERIYGYGIAQANLSRFDFEDGHVEAAIARLDAAWDISKATILQQLLTWYQRHLAVTPSTP